MNLACSWLKLFKTTTKPALWKSTNNGIASAADVFKSNKVVPEIIPNPPKELLKVSFPSGVTVDGGNELTPTQVKDKPTISWTADPTIFHLLYFTDPDSPSRGRPTFREWHHWLVGNILNFDVSKGEVLSDYIPPCPQRGSGKHRFVFLVYRQSGKLAFDEKRLTNKRTSHREQFKIQNLAAKYKLGDPIAGNLFIAEWDQYVEKIYEDLAKL